MGYNLELILLVEEVWITRALALNPLVSHVGEYLLVIGDDSKLILLWFIK